MSRKAFQFHKTSVIKRVLDVSKHGAPGQTVQLKLSDVLVDRWQRAAHIAWIRIYGTYTLTTTTSMTEAEVSGSKGRLQKMLFRDVKLRAASHDHFDTVHGLDVNRYLEHFQGQFDPFAPGSNVFGMGTGAIPDADATVTGVPVSLNIPFVGAHGAPFRYDRLMPAKQMLSDQAYVGYTVANTLAAGVTVTACTALTLEIGLIHYNGLVRYTPWKLKSFDTEEMETIIRPAGALDFLMLCSEAGGDTVAKRSHAGYTLESLTLGGEDILRYPNQTRAEWEAHRLQFEPGYLSTQAYLETSDATKWMLLASDPFDRRATQMARGPVRVKLSAVPADFTRHRYLWLDTGARSEGWHRAWNEGLGLSGARATARSAGAKETPLSGIVPEIVHDDDYPADYAKVKRGRL